MLQHEAHENTERTDLTAARTRSRTRHLGRALGVALLGGVLSLAACDDGAVEEAGEDLDHMMLEAEDTAEEAVDEVEKAIDDAHDGLENKDG